MCASVFSTLIFFFVTGVFTIFVMHGTGMAIEGLPLRRQERDANDQDILAGADFLSVFMESSLRRAFSETTTTTVPTTIVIFEEEENTPQQTGATFLRPSRSTPSFAQTTEHFSDSASDKNVDPSDSSKNSEDGVIVAVRVSSSVGRQINKGRFHHNHIDSTTIGQIVPLPTTSIPDQSFLASEEHPSIIAAASKSELSVEESDPITKESDLIPDFSRSYPASIQELPSSAHSGYTSSFPNQRVNKDNGQQPYQTVIYHDNPSEGARARSVSYSSIIQALPQATVETEKPVTHERHERNYNGAGSPYANIFTPNRAKSNNTRSEDISRPWLKPTSAPTERNWETQEKPYVPPSPTPANLPKVFGRPEQNYEVEEAVSVVTNGRAHGVQPSVSSKPDKKTDDNNKVGYVVEGRNYRKYRVEERTPDGFIVGEYGVVSHNDGSLRGVRYTADGTINPKLISEALLKFLSL
ncbi:hypothetical protein JTB14_017469 [Gonioctena quinquepunctata]|nr:hypothetical protein JTB14_017469 [Gonioctena quinquepunctata]